MTELDCMKQRKGEILAYWKKRLEESRELEKNRACEIQIIPDTLEWFLWMIEAADASMNPICRMCKHYASWHETTTGQCAYRADGKYCKCKGFKS